MQTKTQQVAPEGTAATDRSTVVVEELRGIAAMEQVEALQSAIWGSDQNWVVPSHLLHIASDQGGIVLGAYVDGVLVGFVFGLLARKDGKLLHASHMLGILPRFQGHGIGSALKLRQRDLARAQGLSLMTWTFDPLESRNAYFNFHKLHVSSRSYRPDYYGAMRDHLNQGLPSDRLLVDWDLEDGSHPLPVAASAVPVLLNEGDRPVLHIPDTAPNQPVAIHVPHNIQVLRQESPETALAWRKASRRAFSWAFEQGYIARDFDHGAHILYLSNVSSL